MTPSARTGQLAAIGCGVATFFAFPQRLAGLQLDLGVVLAWLVPALMWVSLAGLRPRAAALRAFAIGWIAHAAVLYWLHGVVHTYGHASWLLGALAPFAAALYIGAIVSLFGAVWAWLAARGAGSPLAFAALWVLADFARTTLFGGFPWAILAYAQHANPLISSLAPFTGIWGIGFVTALVGGWLGERFLHWRAGGSLRRIDLVLPACTALVCLLAFGARSAWPPATTGSLRVAALQGNVDQGQKWDRAHFDETVDVYLGMTRRAAAAGAELVVWPETAVPGPFELEAEARARVKEVVQQTGVSIVLGGVGVRRAPGRDVIHAWLDSAFVLSPVTPRVLRYDKSHLVPFGEYVPLRGLLGGLLKSVASGIAPMDVSAGDGPRTLDIVFAGTDAQAHGARIVRAGVPICYELVFPDLVRRFVADGGRLLLAITNDAWYGRSGAPDQFLAMTAMRSAEGRVWTVRAANTGVSAIIDATGRIRERTAIFERDMIVADVPLLPPADGSKAAGSFYVRHGDYAVAVCAMIAVSLAGLARRRAGGGRGDDSGDERGRAE